MTPSFRSRLQWLACAATTLVVALSVTFEISTAQEAFQHLNPVIAKLAQGKHVVGAATADLSPANGRALARADIDYVYLDMEHNPMRFDDIETLMSAMVDRAAVVRKKSVQPNVALIARFAPYAHENASWVIKQALDIGMMGILFNTVETKEQALYAVTQMRYPQMKGAPYQEPRGRRGLGTGITSWFWGIPAEEYFKHADLWPLNPRGDLLAWMMIESAEGLANVEEIAAVPGVGGLYFGPDDMKASLGVESPESPEVEAAYAKVLSVCKARNLACGGTVTAENVAQRIHEGYRIINLGNTNGGLTSANDAALRAAKAVIR